MDVRGVQQQEANSIRPPFELIEHTADVGIIAYGQTLAELFENAARGMFSIIADIDRVKPQRSISVHVEAPDCEMLLVKWLRELLYQHDACKLLFCDFKVEELPELSAVEYPQTSQVTLHGVARGQPIGEADVELYGDIKAVTYHGLKVEREGGVWRAQIIFDV